MKKTFTKAQRKLIEDGGIVYKDTKPDITDNLMKGVADALEGIVYVNDSRICKVASQKIFGVKPRIEIKFYTLNASS